MIDRSFEGDDGSTIGVVMKIELNLERVWIVVGTDWCCNPHCLDDIS